ncbi:MAG TPA: glycoside hydrolase family 2 TIM barrel-domain containing protein, partial [Bacteroidales bacterium]|nr:glycoside hydrolase family 2 TIM barrel-domain containing protein [Bacteroidales bacterium]
MKVFKFGWSIISIVIAFPVGLLSQSRQDSLINDGWQFVMTELPANMVIKSDLNWKNVSLPHTWNNMDIQSGEKVNYGTAWYRRELQPGTDLNEKQVFLRFEGVGQYAALFINGRYVGEHLGSYSAFAFNITGFMKPDTVNYILVKVNNELNLSYPKDNFLFGIFGGIYRDVSMIITGNIHIGITDWASSGIYVHPKNVNKDQALLDIVAMVKNDGAAKKKITIRNRLIDKNGAVQAMNEADTMLFPGGMVPVSMGLQVSAPHLWHGLTDPYLYRLDTEVIMDNKIIDRVSQPYGIRFYEIDPGQGFILNGEPYRLYGVCRHQEWQDLGNALLPEHHKKDMELIRELGATSIRLAHYQQAEYIYDLADEMGFLIWA